MTRANDLLPSGDPENEKTRLLGPLHENMMLYNHLGRSNIGPNMFDLRPSLPEDCPVPIADLYFGMTRLEYFALRLERKVDEMDWSTLKLKTDVPGEVLLQLMESSLSLSHTSVGRNQAKAEFSVMAKTNDYLNDVAQKQTTRETKKVA